MKLERRATLFLVLTTGIWGATFFSMQLAAEAIAAGVPASARPYAGLLLMALRFVIASAAFVCVFPGALRRLDNTAWRHALILGIPWYAGMMLQLDGLRDTTPTIVAFLTNITVILTPVFGLLFFRERQTPGLVLGAVLAFTGIYVLTNPAGGGFGRAEIAAALSAVTFSLQIQLTNVYTRRGDPEAITLGMFLLSIVFSLAGLAAFPDAWPLLAPSVSARVMTSAGPLVAILFNALAASVVAIWVLNRFQREVPATRAAVIYAVEPVFAAAFSAVFIGEPMTARKIVGGSIIIAANVVCALMQPRRAGVAAAPADGARERG